VGGHRLSLTTNDGQNTPVAEDENRQYGDVEGQMIPDHIGDPCGRTPPEDTREARAVDDVGGRRIHRGSDDSAADPRERDRRVYHPVAQVSRSPDVVNNPQIAVDGNRREVDRRTSGGLCEERRLALYSGPRGGVAA